MNKNLVWQKSVFSPPQNEKIFQTILSALHKILDKTPNVVAIITKEKSYTFKDLIDRIGGLTDEILKKSSDNKPIALLQKSGIDAIAAWFACSYLGRAFLLLEPEHPKIRLIELIKEAGCSLVLADEFTATICNDLPNIKILISDGSLGNLHAINNLDAEAPAMIFPTSGSTGNPKLITYASSTILVKVQSSIEQMRVPIGAKVFIAGSHSNYGFLHHALVFLLSGGTVCLSDIKTFGFDAIIDSIQNHGVRHIRFTPSLFRKFALFPNAKNALQRLDGVRFSGEPLLKSDLLLAQSVLQKKCLIQNVYGSTESSLFIWSYLNGEDIPDFEIVPIGKIYPHSSFAIQPLEEADKNKGELIIKSTFQALGDLKNGEIDTQRFPLLENTSNERLYVTGDIVQQLPNGDLIVLGRLGRMVKIRGNRVFLNEIENQLRRIKSITGAAVVDIDCNGDTELVGFITVTQNLSVELEDIKLELAKNLPDFMIPKQFKIIQNIPLLQGGKVDYNYLNALITEKEKVEEKPIFEDDFARLTYLWDSVLWKGAHQYYSDFLALGGDSLNLMILIAKIEKEFGKKVLIEDFKLNSTLHALAMLLNIQIPLNYNLNFSDNLQIKLFAPCTQITSKGIALAMPGYRGWTQAYSVYKSGILQDYDIWVAEYPIKKGFIIDDNQWWHVAQQIVQYIQSGKIIPPKIIFGFSFSGGLAWVVSQLLNGTDKSPELVIMIDSPALHRLKKYKINPLLNALKRIKHIPPIPSLHIKRKELFNNKKFIRKNYEWNFNENVQLNLYLPTVEHLEMINWKLLSVVKEKSIAFLNHNEINFIENYPLDLPNLLGVNIFKAFNGEIIAFENVLNELKKGLNLFSADYLIHITILLYVKNYHQKANEVAIYNLEKNPNSYSIQFLHRRLRFKENLLVDENSIQIFPNKITEIEHLLASKHSKSNKKPFYLYRFFIFISDLSIAFLKTQIVKIKNRF